MNRWFGRGWRLVLLMTIPFMPGCAGSRNAYRTDMPVSHRQAAVRALSGAFEALGIPGGNSSAASLRIEDSGRSADSMLRSLAEEYLVRKGYRIHAGDDAPGFVFRADTLFVALDRVGGLGNSSEARSAGASVTVTFRPDDTSRLVYEGKGTFCDTIPRWAASSMGRDEEYVNDRGHVFAAVKPVFLGFLVTGFLWLLYSYRG